MGLLRLVLALSVVTAHVGPLFGLRFFGGGVMSVESFYILSGFYMALVLSTRYRERTKDFYFNRIVRLAPIYWMLVGAGLIAGGVYWLAVGHPIGALSAWRTSSNPLHWVWAGITNVAIVGADWAELFSNLTHPGSGGVNHLLVIEATWSLAVELLFYAAAPFLLRLSRLAQGTLFLGALAIRIAIWFANGSCWSIWLYYFAPASWVFFLGGVHAYHLTVWLESRRWFAAHAVWIGHTLTLFLVLLIASYAAIPLLRFQDFRYYLVFGLSLPFIFTSFKRTTWDAALAAWSYPIYLAHSLIVSLSPPLRHFVSPAAMGYVILAITVVICASLLWADERIQQHFKRTV